jgi:large subunit ribosomal protein L24
MPTGAKHLDIRRNDTVKVISGRDKGKQGRVLRVFPDKGRVLVEHVAMVKKTVSRRNPQSDAGGGIAEQESPVAVSNVMLICAQCGPTRIAHHREGDRNVRVCKKCGSTLEK